MRHSAEKAGVEGYSEDQINDSTPDLLLQLYQKLEAEWMNNRNTEYYGALQAGPVMSVWEYELGIINENPYFLSNQKQYHVEGADYHVFEGYGRREGTLGQLRRMIVFRDGIRYTLETVVPENYQNDNVFVERLFGSFAPVDTIMAYSVFENKLQIFLEHLQSSNDSIRSSALASIRYLNFDKTNLKEIHEILNLLEIKNEDTETLKVLLQEIAAINDPQIIRFVQETYRQDNVNTTLKVALLRGLAKQENHQAYELIIELLDYYLPIPERKNEIESLFREFERNTRYSSALVPRVFDHFIVEEYKNPILNFCRKLMQSDHFEPEKFEPVKDILLANANLEFRRTRSWVNNRKSRKQKTLGYDAVRATRGLNTYLHLIHPFIGEERFAQWWNNVHDLQIPEILLEMLNLELNQKATDAGFANQLLQKEETLFAATVLLSAKAPDFQLPQTTATDLARSGVVLLDHVDLDNQELTFFKEITTRHNDKTIRFLFYKCKDKETRRGQVEETILMSKGFVLDENGEIIPGAFFSGLQKPIKDPEKIDEYIFEVIDQSLNWNNNRANYMKSDFSGNPFFGFNMF
jgi:hypothetical protein